jgi:hypothetical protein
LFGANLSDEEEDETAAEARKQQLPEGILWRKNILNSISNFSPPKNWKKRL